MPSPSSYDFTIPVRVPTLNVLMRMHFRKRHRLLNQLAWHVVAAAGKAPPRPFQKARVVIERESTQEPDPDGLKASVKSLLDVLQPVSKRHPLGLGFIKDDSADCIDLEVRHIQGKGARTRVMIVELP